MRHQIPAHLSVVRKRQKGQPSALNGAERNNDFCIGRDGQWSALGDDLRHTLSPRVAIVFSRMHMASSQNHEALFHIIEAGLVRSFTRRFHQQRNGTELIEREESSMTGLSLHRQRGFQLHLIQGVSE